jgi:hypothetical protein
VQAVREEYAEVEAEAAELEAAESAAALDVSLSLRVSRDPYEALKARSTEEPVPPSALVRRARRAPRREQAGAHYATGRGDRPTCHA